jgi:chromosome segregation ATPase
MLRVKCHNVLYQHNHHPKINVLLYQLNSLNKDLLQQLKQLKTINDNLVAQLDDANKKLRAAQRQNDVDQSKIGALEADLKAAREKLADLPAQLSAAKGEAATNQKLYEGALVQIGDLRTKMNTLQQENTELGSRIEAVTSQSSASSQTTQVELKESVMQNKFLRDKTAQLQDEINGLEAEVGALERRAQELTAANAALKAENKDLGDLLDAAKATLQKDKEKTTEIITKTQRIPESLQDKIDILTTQLKVAQSLTMAIQQDMVPVEETSYSTTTSRESSSSSTETKK